MVVEEEAGARCRSGLQLGKRGGLDGRGRALCPLSVFERSEKVVVRVKRRSTEQGKH